MGTTRSMGCSGMAYTLSPPGTRTLTAPRSSRSRETVDLGGGDPHRPPGDLPAAAWLESRPGWPRRRTRSGAAAGDLVTRALPPWSASPSSQASRPRAACIRLAAWGQTRLDASVHDLVGDLLAR